MTQMTELHEADYMPPIAVLNFAIPDSVQRDVAEAYFIGAKKYQNMGAELDCSESIEYYWGAFSRHLVKLRQGHIYDGNDGHKHLAALIIRLCQIGAKLNEQNDPNVDGYGVA